MDDATNDELNAMLKDVVIENAYDDEEDVPVPTKQPRLTKKGKPDKRFNKSADNAKKAREALAAKRKAEAEADDEDDEAPKKSKRVTKKDIENNKQEEMAEKLRLLQAQVDSYQPKPVKKVSQ